MRYGDQHLLKTQGASPNKINLLHVVKSKDRDLRLSLSRAHLIKYGSLDGLETDLREIEMPDIEIILEKAKDLWGK